MAEAKTKPTTASVKAYLDAIENDERRKDCKTLVTMMKRVTGCAPKMWGTSIVGFGTYHYKYASGHEGDSCLVGFAPRASAISVYLYPGEKGTAALFKALGPHKFGKACLYLKRLADIQLPVLEQLVALSVAETKRRHP
jgi:Domain of unknown function (DU1801)